MRTLFVLPQEALLRARIDIRHEQGVQNMLGSQTFERVFGGPMERGFAYDEFPLGGEIKLEFLAV